MGVYELPSTKEVVRFLHAALGNPTQATLLTAAQHGNLVTFPGMTPQNILRHFPESDETQKGHMKQTKQGVRSTKIVDEDAMMLGVKHQPGVKHKDVYLIVFDATKKSMFSDQTGKFPITSARGNKYRLGVARPFLMLKALFLILPLILPFKHWDWGFDPSDKSIQHKNLH